ncbi:hypothetical protein BC940DRAFT_294706 [Gongronella butleri]|nr:hypothetical protein BC940DRAFT_294706 [Gongronella butleri]
MSSRKEQNSPSTPSSSASSPVVGKMPLSDAQRRWSRLREAVVTEQPVPSKGSPQRQSRPGLFNTFRPFSPLQPHAHTQQRNLASPTTRLSGMTNENQTGGIYAATTLVQQDIYQLERELKKVLIHPAVFHRHATFAIAHIDLSPGLDQLETILHQHQVATKLPLLDDLLAFLLLPFHQTPVLASECVKALDIFDHVQQRFTELNAMENYEMVFFCCRALSVHDDDLKARLLATLHGMIATGDKDRVLPSIPSVFHSLVFALTDALVHDAAHRGAPSAATAVHDGIVALLDRLANGQWVPVLGDDWNAYCSDMDAPIPVCVARFAVLEGLAKALMIDHGGPVDPDKNTSSPSCDTTRDQLILQFLFKRYWLELDQDTLPALPAYLSVTFILSEAAIEKFLSGSVKDIAQPGSTVSLLWAFFQEKYPQSKVHELVPLRAMDKLQQAVLTNLIMTAMAILSISRLDMSLVDVRTWSDPLDDDASSIGVVPAPEGAQQRQQHVADTISSIRAYLIGLWRHGYDQDIVDLVQGMLEDSAGERTIVIYENLAFYLDHPAISTEIVTKTLPTLFSRLTSTYPAPFSALCQLLVKLSQTYKLAFYRPVVSCVAAQQVDQVVPWLTLFSCLRRYMSVVQLWMQDGEMICVLLLSDMVDDKRPFSSRSTAPPPQQQQWGTTSLGQCVVAAELLWAVRELRQRQRNPARNMEEDELGKKFLIDLERRFAVFMAAKEKLRLIPMPLRVIISNILMEIRFFCNTTHRPGWLTRVIDWTTQPIGEQHPPPVAKQQQEEPQQAPRLSADHLDPFASSSSSSSHPHRAHLDASNASSEAPTISLAMLEDVSLMFERMGMVYAASLEQLVFESSEHIEYGGERPMMVALNDNHSLDDVHAHVFNDPLAFRGKRQLIISMMYPINRHAAASLDLAPPALTKSDYHKTMATASELSKARLEELTKIHQDPFEAVLSLLVAIFTTMSSHEFAKLVTPLWQRFMNPSYPPVFLPAAFLFMQCGEKVPDAVISNTIQEFYSADAIQRNDALVKLASLNTYRLNILSQEYIHISSKRRPFQGDGGAFSTPFVPADLGSDQLTMDEPRWMAKLKNASNFPIELKRQIQELGWDDEDKGEEYEALKKVLTPLVLLPTMYLDEAYETQDETDVTAMMAAQQQQASAAAAAVTTSSSVATAAAAAAAAAASASNGNKNNSSTGMMPDGTSWVTYISKMVARRKRATVVPAVNASFFCMIDSLCDNFGGVHNSLRETLEKFLRDDPDLFLRGFLSDLGKSNANKQRDALTRLYALVHMQAKLPPGLTHTLFNHLAGMLKWLCREHTKQTNPMLMCLIHPILAQLVLSTNELSMRDFRKNKIEAVLTSTGRFWFVVEQPVAMFPRRLNDPRTSFTILDIPDELFAVATLRISHIQFLSNFLIRYPREVYAVKKSLQPYEHMDDPTMHNNEDAEDDDSDLYLPDLRLCHTQPRHLVYFLRQFQRQQRRHPRRHASQAQGTSQQPSQLHATMAPHRQGSSSLFSFTARHHHAHHHHAHHQHNKYTAGELMDIPLEMLELNDALSDALPRHWPGARDEKDISGENEDNADEEENDDDDNDDELRPQPRPSQEREDVDMLALLRDRVWLRFIDILLNGLNKNYNDRAELGRILGSVNGILIRHYYDYGLVGQALVLFTRLVTRFKRLFSSNHGYHTFLPALFKVYCQVEPFPHIRSAITFAWCRFYAVHEEAFVFQMLGSLAPLLLKAYSRSPILGAWMADNLFSLMQALDDPPQLGQTSDVLGLQLQVELDDHERSIQERIDAVSNPMTMPLATSILKPLGRSMTAPITPLVINNYSNQPFPLANFIKLFLTIIAYDPSSLRAEQFVILFRHLLPQCYRTSNDLAALIHEGIDALILIFTKFSRNTVPLFTGHGDQEMDATQAEQGVPAAASQEQQQQQQQQQRLLSESVPGMSNDRFGFGSATGQHAYGKHWQQNDRYMIKVEFVRLIRQFHRCGGRLTEQQRASMAHVLRMIVRDTGMARNNKIRHTTWLKDYWVDEIHAVQPQDYAGYVRSFKKCIHQIYQQWRAQYKTLDGASIYQGLALVVRTAHERTVPLSDDIYRHIKERYIAFGLSIINNGGQIDFPDATRYDMFCRALVHLILTLMEVPSSTSSSVLAEIAQLNPTPSLLAKVVIPLCFDLGRHLQPHQRAGQQHLATHWRDLLNLVMKACAQSLYHRHHVPHASLHGHHHHRSSVLGASSSRFGAVMSMGTAKDDNTDHRHHHQHTPSADLLVPIDPMASTLSVTPPSPMSSSLAPQLPPLHFDSSLVAEDPTQSTAATTTTGPAAPGSRHSTGNKRPPPLRISSWALQLVLGLTAIKIIVFRGQLHRMDAGQLGLVTRLAYFIKSTLIFDQASSHAMSYAPPSPLKSRDASRAAPPSAKSTHLGAGPSSAAPLSSQLSSPGGNSSVGSVPSHSSHAVSMATLFDYASWQFLEFVAFTKSPLMLPLNGYIKEKLAMALAVHAGSSAGAFSGASPFLASSASPLTRVSPATASSSFTGISGTSPTNKPSPSWLAPPTMAPPHASSPTASSSSSHRRAHSTGSHASDAIAINIPPSSPVGPGSDGLWPLPTTSGSSAKAASTTASRTTSTGTAMHQHLLQCLDQRHQSVQAICLLIGYPDPYASSSSSSARVTSWTNRETLQRLVAEWHRVLQIYREIMPLEHTSSASATDHP